MPFGTQISHTQSRWEDFTAILEKFSSLREGSNDNAARGIYFAAYDVILGRDTPGERSNAEVFTFLKGKQV